VSAFGVKPSFEGFVSHFSVAPEGQITFRGCVSSDGSGGKCGEAGGSKLLRETVGIAVSPNDASLYSASESGVISHYAIDKDLTLKEAALANGVSEELFDKVVVPINMTRPGSADVS